MCKQHFIFPSCITLFEPVLTSECFLFNLCTYGAMHAFYYLKNFIKILECKDLFVLMYCLVKKYCLLITNIGVWIKNHVKQALYPDYITLFGLVMFSLGLFRLVVSGFVLSVQVFSIWSIQCHFRSCKSFVCHVCLMICILNELKSVLSLLF